MIPSFNLLSIDLTEQDFQTQLSAARESTGKVFKPGKYDLIIKKAEWHKENQHDPSWFGLQVTLGDKTSERTVRVYVSVPTKSIKYAKPGVKNPLSLFIMFREFVEALGASCQVQEVADVLSTLFSDVTNLVGKPISVIIGHKGPYIERIAEKQFKVVEKDGKDMKFEDSANPVFTDRESAIAEMQIRYGLDLSRTFPEVLKYIKPEVNDDF